MASDVITFLPNFMKISELALKFTRPHTGIWTHLKLSTLFRYYCSTNSWIMLLNIVHTAHHFCIWSGHDILQRHEFHFRDVHLHWDHTLGYVISKSSRTPEFTACAIFHISWSKKNSTQSVKARLHNFSNHMATTQNCFSKQPKD
jgi:hypothetical protein